MLLTLDDVERQHIVATLRFTEGNKLKAAELLGIGRYSRYRKAERLGIDLDSLSIRSTLSSTQKRTVDVETR